MGGYRITWSSGPVPSQTLRCRSGIRHCREVSRYPTDSGSHGLPESGRAAVFIRHHNRPCRIRQHLLQTFRCSGKIQPGFPIHGCPSIYPTCPTKVWCRSDNLGHGLSRSPQGEKQLAHFGSGTQACSGRYALPVIRGDRSNPWGNCSRDLESLKKKEKQCRYLT